MTCSPAGCSKGFHKFRVFDLGFQVRCERCLCILPQLYASSYGLKKQYETLEKIDKKYSKTFKKLAE